VRPRVEADQRAEELDELVLATRDLLCNRLLELVQPSRNLRRTVAAT
jgi:hypothetical protein